MRIPKIDRARRNALKAATLMGAFLSTSCLPEQAPGRGGNSGNSGNSGTAAKTAIVVAMAKTATVVRAATLAVFALRGAR